ncbi:hypothetical protein B0O99DRAFT_662875 [Bisporella sp. PMI_857]|nr:hypothetical protein B0O99DRAFT_662875 [Bisporella sp. PMI_857]
MADVATPSVEDKKTKVFEKPEKPDEDAFKSALKKAEKEHADAQAKFDAANTKVKSAIPNKDKETPQGKRRQELIAELKTIREKQQSGKSGREKTMDEVKKLDEKVKSLQTQRNNARSQTPFKSLDEIDRKIKDLDHEVESGKLKIVDEKKKLAEISTLRRQRKAFPDFAAQEKAIEEEKKKLATLRGTLDNPESKALSERYSKLQAELDAIKAEQDDAYKNISSLRDDSKKLRDIAQEKWLAIKKLKDDHYQAGRAFKQYEYQAREKARERRKAEQEAFEKEKKKERAQRLLDEASDKAYLDEIRRAESLLRFLDPSYTKENAPLKAPSQFAIQAGRTVDDSGFKGVKVVKKEEEDYFKGTGGKKGKKGRKAAESSAPATSGKYSCPPSVMEDCSLMGIDPPMSADDIPAVREKVKAKLDFWKQDQDEQTKKEIQNIAKAKKEVERLDAEDSAASSTPHPTPVNGHGETKATASVDEGGSVANEIALEDAALADATADLKEAKLEDDA